VVTKCWLNLYCHYPANITVWRMKKPGWEKDI
jgi:hypothetical protein